MKSFIKIISLATVLALVLAFVACGGETPAVTTEAPAVTTEAPAVTTEAPAVTTEAPVETTEAPVETTEAPVETTEAPVETTEAPVETTEAPVETTEAPVETTEAPAVTEKAPVEYGMPSAYAGLDYKFDINGYTFYAHHGTWELIEAEGEDKGALHLKEGKGIALVHDLDYTKNVTISSKVKIDADAEAGNLGYAMNAWWNEDGYTDDNWVFFENETAGYFYCYLSGKRSAGLIGKYDGGVSLNGTTGWESFNDAKIASYGIPAFNLFNGGVLADVVWEQGKYYDFSCTWDAETLTLSTTLEGIPLYSVTFTIHPLSVQGDDFGLRSNVADVYFKDITITVDK